MKWLCEVLRAPSTESTFGSYDPQSQVSVMEVDGRHIPAVSRLSVNNVVLATKTLKEGDLDEDGVSVNALVVSTKTKIAPGDIDQDNVDLAVLLATKTLFRDMEQTD